MPCKFLIKKPQKTDLVWEKPGVPEVFQGEGESEGEDKQQTGEEENVGRVVGRVTA